jgi:hypothetical protein
MSNAQQAVSVSVMRELTLDELNAVSGGDGGGPAPSPCTCGCGGKADPCDSTKDGLCPTN